MGFWAKLFGGSNIVDGAMSMIDKAFYTDEEQARDNQEAEQKKLDWYLTYLQNTTNSALARRVLAFMFSITFLLMCFVWMGMSLYEVWNPSAELIKAIGLMEKFIDKFVTLVMLILAFYFGPQQFERLIGAWNKKGG